jgi:hypothetical protein
MSDPIKLEESRPLCHILQRIFPIPTSVVIADCGLRIANCQLRIADCEFEISNFRLKIAD